MKRLALLLILSQLIFSSSALAEMLKLSAAIDEAKQNNPELKGLAFEVSAKKAQISPAGALPDPNVALSAMNYPISSFSSDKFEMTGNQIEVSQLIPFPGKRAALERAAQSEAQRAEADLQSQSSTVIRDLKIAYYDLYFSETRDQIIQEKLKILKDVLKISRDNYSLGRVTQLDLLSLEVERSKLEAELYDAQASERLNRAHVNNLMGREDHSNAWKTEEPQLSKVDLTAQARKLAIAQALEGNPKLSVLSAESRTSKEMANYAALNTRPDFEIGAGYTQRKAVGDGSGDDFASVRFGLNIPLWAKSKQLKEREAAEFRVQRSKTALKEQRNHVLHQIELLMAEAERLRNQLKLIEISVLPLTEKAVQSAHASYLSQQIGFSEMLGAINRASDAKLERARLVIEHEKNIAELQSLTASDLGISSKGAK